MKSLLASFGYLSTLISIAGLNGAISLNCVLNLPSITPLLDSCASLSNYNLSENAEDERLEVLLMVGLKGSNFLT